MDEDDDGGDSFVGSRAGLGSPEGFPGGLSPSPPRYFTFEPPVGASCPPRPRRRHRRVLYPPVVRRPPPPEEPNAAKRLLVLLLAVVSAQVYSAPGDTTPEAPVVTPEAPVATLEAPTVTPATPAVTSLPGDGALLRTATPTSTPGATLAGTPAAPMGASCPRLLLSPALRPHNCTAGGTRPLRGHPGPSGWHPAPPPRPQGCTRHAGLSTTHPWVLLTSPSGRHPGTPGTHYSARHPGLRPVTAPSTHGCPSSRTLGGHSAPMGTPTSLSGLPPAPMGAPHPTSGLLTSPPPPPPSIYLLYLFRGYLIAGYLCLFNWGLFKAVWRLFNNCC
ncbi:uncharacterized protein LOC142359828 [Opisthocomus hoazin]|uniref:uncharacterized protein LOC142359828 n=1 Tax=Opisthocomus hoazin TaxID=30419 RepID=UPI003F5398B2